jgi:TPR repeat protein
MADNYKQTLVKAEAGDEYAMECLGEFSFGNAISGAPIEDFPKNPREGERWLLKLIAVTQDPQRKGSALHNMGIAYEEGVSFPRNISKASDYYRQAADLGGNYTQSMQCKHKLDELERGGSRRSGLY